MHYNIWMHRSQKDVETGHEWLENAQKGAGMS